MPSVRTAGPPREALEIDGDDDRRIKIVFGLVDGYAGPVLAPSRPGGIVPPMLCCMG